MTTFARLKEIDRRWKPTDSQRHWQAQSDLYHDHASDLVRARLREQGVGQANDLFPLHLNVLRRVVETLAVTYRRPASRYLRNPVGRRLAESSGEHRSMVEAYRTAQVDAILKEADKRRSLFRQVALRLYADDTRRGIAIRIFAPLAVMRWPDPSAADDIVRDFAFGLKLADNRWELWSRLDENERPTDRWRMMLVDGDGLQLPTPEQPFAMMPEPMASPYPEPPVVLLHDSITAGDPWLAPKHSRSTVPLAIATLGALQIELARLQAHHEVHLLQQPEGDPATPAEISKDAGPGTRHVHPPSIREVKQLEASPALEAVQDVMERTLSMFALSEDVPHDLFRRSQIVTGSALEVLEEPLRARREEQASLAELDERRLYERFASVHNVHAPGWGRPVLPTNVELDVELAPRDAPTSPDELITSMSRAITLGAASPIDLISSLYNIPRAAAIEMHERIADDLESYPMPSPDAASTAIEGRRPSQPGGLADSTVDDARRAGGAQ